MTKYGTMTFTGFFTKSTVQVYSVQQFTPIKEPEKDFGSNTSTILVFLNSEECKD